MTNFNEHLGNLSGVEFYEVRIEFTEPMEPSLISEYGLPYVSFVDEVSANSMTQKSKMFREEYGRVPYASPLYLWEVQTGKERKLLYIGRTIKQKLQKRFEGHVSVVRLLSQYVNDSTAFVYFRMCSRLDLTYKQGNSMVVRAIEHFPVEQAKLVISDIEAFLIYNCQPEYNTHYKKSRKKQWIQFTITQTLNIDIGTKC